MAGNAATLAPDLLCKITAYQQSVGRYFPRMKGTQLGEFEELVLLTVAFLYDEAYSVAVMEALSRRAERPMVLGVAHRTLKGGVA